MGKAVDGFVGDRLREAREARALTITALADLAGLSRQSISSYENEKKSPSLEVLENISNKLNLPKMFFFYERNEESEKTIFFRSLSAATKSARTRAARRFVWLQDIAAYLGNFFYFPPVNLPPIIIDNTPEKLADEDIELIAEETRKFWKLGNGPLSRVLSLLENNGIIVGMGTLDSASLDAFSQRPIDGGSPFIFLSSDKQVAVRTRFDACHELGHIILHGSVDRISNPSALKMLESQAFRFAASFLLPAPTFLRELSSPTLDNFLVLKERWGCSVAMMIKRCEDLEIISQERKDTLWKRYTWRKWRRNEPLDDELESEQPVFLKSCIESLLKEGVKTKQDILNDLALAANDVEDLVCLPTGFFNDKFNPSTPELITSVSNRTEGKIIYFPKKQ